jgi:hypothetical protein
MKTKDPDGGFCGSDFDHKVPDNRFVFEGSHFKFRSAEDKGFAGIGGFAVYQHQA